METIKKTTILKLTETFVNIETQDYILINGVDAKLDTLPHNIHYVNCPSGRASLQSQQPDNIVASVMAIWGDTPTVEEPEIPNE